MIAIILCAGFGTRMYPLTEYRPKALLPVAGRPVIDYLLDQLMHLPDLTTVHVVSNDRFYHHFEEWREMVAPRLNEQGIPLELHNDQVSSNEERLGANGDLAFVLERTGLPDGALIAAGDNILQFNLLPIWERFQASKENLVIALAESVLEKLKKTGVLILDDSDRVIGFVEKPAEPPSQWSCPPFYFLNRSALEQADPFINQANPPDAMGHLINYLIGQVSIRAIKISGNRLDIGTNESYRAANSQFEQTR
jgi:glucose-1-phosphate thymidylyltransferase